MSVFSSTVTNDERGISAHASNSFTNASQNNSARPSIGRSVSVLNLHLGLTTRFLLLSDSCGFLDVGRSLWRVDGSVIYNCCCPSPAQSFSCPSPVVCATIFYCLRLETLPTRIARNRAPQLYRQELGSLFVTSYDSQGYGGGIRTRSTRGWYYSLHTLVKVKVALRLAVSQSVSLLVEPHLGLMTRYLLLVDSYGLVV
jgi:hypothetical protein